MTPKTLTIRRGSCVQVDQFANHAFQPAKRAGNERRSRFFAKRRKGGENFREKNKFRCKVKIVIP